MDYSLITEQQAQKRYDSLPDKIRSVLDSESNVMAVGQICRQHHLDDERILMINQLITMILLGFVSANDFRQEVMDNLHLNYQHSNDIAKEVHEKIFAPIRGEIDKIYSPSAKEIISQPEEKDNAPLTEIHKEKEGIVDLRIFEKKEIKKPKKEFKEFFQPVEDKKESEKLKEKEIEKQAEIKKEPFAVPLPEKTISEVGPVIIHKEIEIKPTLSKQRSLGGLFGFLKSQKEGEIKIREQKPITAELEMPIAPPVMDKNKIELPKMVHYGDFKTTVKIPEMPMPPKIDKIESLAPKPVDIVNKELNIKSKIFESEIEKAKAAGLIVNNKQASVDISQAIDNKSQIKDNGAQTDSHELKDIIDNIPIEIEEILKIGFFRKIFQFFESLFITKQKVIKEVSVPLPPKSQMQPNSEPAKKEIESFVKFGEIVKDAKIIKSEQVVQPVYPQYLPRKEEDNIKKTESEKMGDDIIDLRTFERVKKI